MLVSDWRILLTTGSWTYRVLCFLLFLLVLVVLIVLMVFLFRLDDEDVVAFVFVEDEQVRPDLFFPPFLLPC